jgi:protein ImuB
MRSRILSLWLPNLATDRLLRRAARALRDKEPPGELEPGAAHAPDAAGAARGGRAPLRPDRPLATFAGQNGALRLAAVCPRARAAGLAPGMMLADARALLPELQVHPAEPAADARLLEDLAAWCERYTPQVAIDRSAPHDPGGALWLDVTGCAHLFGGEAGLRTDLLARLGRQGLAAAAAIADCPGAAWAAARHAAAERQIVPPCGARAALAPLPVAALRLEPELSAMLERLGLARIEELYPLPRPALTARFGAALVTRLEQADGRLAEPISPRRARPAHRVQLPLAEPLLEVAALGVLTERLLDQLCAGLAAAGLGARRLTLALYRVDNSTACVAIGTSRPCRAPRQLARLFAEKLAQVDPGFGIERAILAAEVVEPLLPEPLAWRSMGAGDLDQARDLAPLVDRLSNRLGAGAVSQLVPVASHLPERAQRRVPALDQAPRRGAALDQNQPAAFLPRPLHGPAPARPLRLLARPEPIEAVAAVPDEPPVLFRWRQAVHRVARARGPERLAPEWWRAPAADPDLATRDYFAVEDSEGGRFWLFRESLYRAGAGRRPRWYLHGLFA